MQEMNENQVVKLTNLDVQNMNIRKLNNAGENFLKEALIVNLKLTKEAIKHYNAILKAEIQIDLYVDNIPIDVYKRNLEQERDKRTVRRRSRNSDDLHVKRRSSIMDKPKEVLLHNVEGDPLKILDINIIL